MTTRVLLLPLRLTLALLIGLALSASVFAHRVSIADQVALDRFILSGGSLDDICEDGEETSHAGGGCEACRLVDAFALGADPVVPLANPRLLPLGAVPEHPIRPHTVRWDLPCARAPPALPV